MCYENLGIALKNWKLAHLLTLSEQTGFTEQNVFHRTGGRAAGEQESQQMESAPKEIEK